MGVPKFFRYISERYPCLSELAREQCIPKFDNLYLDMNGIIHNCSHPDDSNVHFSISEDDMFKDIFNYIDKLFFLIKPQKVFFMAVDGVAPRAKMNQQRGRRFRSAKDATLLELQAKNRGEIIKETRFDSNCITPGTEFMVRLQAALRYFIKSKISSDPLWQKCRIILSGHNSPGEGEHKIMDYIRYLKSQDDFDPNTRHCLYGLDADLIILGMCTHELHFVVLREEVKFGRKTKRTSVEETRFFLLHIGLLREYIELEFDELKNGENDESSFNISHLIDDWVLIGLLVGNDFVPHLPFLHISSNVLPLLYKTYIKVYPKLGGNINECGQLNLERLEIYFEALSEIEFDLFKETYNDLKYFNAKKTENGIDEAFDFDVNEIKTDKTDEDLAELIANSEMLLDCENDEELDEKQSIIEEFEAYKRNYYMSKLQYNEMTSELKKQQTIDYITALQWILFYYYRGVQSWEWYFPHHYAPFISDLKDFKDHQFDFKMGKPFLPFEQLLGVLPSASKDLLPLAYRKLMTSPSSEVIQYYPEDFETDLNGKKQEWEAIVLIPFIDEKQLLKAMKKCEIDLTSSEIKRNAHGPMFEYEYTAEPQGSEPGICSFKTIQNVFCTEKSFWADKIAIPSNTDVYVELKNAAHNVFVPGFPTMKHLKFSFDLKHSRVRVFEQVSRNANYVLLPENQPGHDDISIVAEKFLNQTVFIGWPHLVKAKVVSISNAENYIDSEGMREMEKKLFQLHVSTAQEHLMTRMGIKFQDMSVMVHVRTCIGSSYTHGTQGKISLKDLWNTAETVYPAQGLVANIPVWSDTKKIPHKKIENLFSVNSTIFFVGNPYYGSEGTVLNPMLVYECGRLKVNITVLPEPDFTEARLVQQQIESDYINSHQAAYKIGIQPKCLSKISGTILLIMGPRRHEAPDNTPKINLGLQFRFPKQQEERSGYARRIGNSWYYSTKAIELVKQYLKKYPMVFDYLSRIGNGTNDFCFESDLFPSNVGESHITDMVNWLNRQDHIKADRIACGSKSLEREAVTLVLQSIENLKTLPVKTVKLQVKPHLLLKPDINLPATYKPNRPVRLFDRVVVVKTTYMLPLGSKGTVVGIHPVTDPNPVRLECVKTVDNFFDVLFDKKMFNGTDMHGLAEGRVLKVPQTSLLLIYTQDNVKVNESNFDSKITNFIDNSSKSIEINDNSKITSSASEPYVAKNMKSALNQLPQICQTEKVNPIDDQTKTEDFWMPSTSIKQNKIKQSENIVNSSILEQSESVIPKSPSRCNIKEGQLQHYTQLNQHQIAQRQQTTQSAFPRDCQSGTEVLKNLLGLQQNASLQQSEAQSRQQQQQQHQQQKNQHQVPMEDNWRYQCRAQQLPQPPPCWRNDALQYTHSPMQQQIRSIKPNYQNVFNNNLVGNMRNAGPLQYYGHNITYHGPTNHQSMNPPNDNFYRAINLNQKGAFIPTQALRNTHASRPPTSTDIVQPDEQVNKTNSHVSSSINASTSALGTHSQNEQKINFYSGSKQLNAAQRKAQSGPAKVKPPRIPKIGAKFDYVHSHLENHQQ